MKLQLTKKGNVSYEEMNIDFRFRVPSADSLVLMESLQSEDRSQSIDVMKQIISKFLVSCELTLEDEKGEELNLENNREEWINNLPSKLFTEIFMNIVGVVKESEVKK